MPGRINFDESQADARYSMQETSSGTLEVIDTSTDTVVMEFDGTDWQLRSDTDHNGNSISGLGGSAQSPRGEPTTSELPSGSRMQYVSDGSDLYSAGDLVSARNDSGTIVSQVIAPASSDS